MGYYTDFILTVRDDVNNVILDDNPRLQEIAAILLRDDVEDGHYMAGFEKNTSENVFTLDGAKWYEYENDMKRFSNEFKDVLFELRGNGEEEDDRWIRYFLNGKVQVCQAEITIVYPEFDLSKME